MTEKQEKQINDTSLNNQAFWHFAEGLFYLKNQHFSIILQILLK